MDNVNNGDESICRRCSTSSYDEDIDDPLEALLSAAEAEIKLEPANGRTDSVLTQDIDLLFKQPRLSTTTDIYHYWSSHENTELGRIALVAISLPVTQVSVERTFSGLKHILSDIRMSMKPDIVDAIMTLRCNV